MRLKIEQVISLVKVGFIRMEKLPLKVQTKIVAIQANIKAN